LSASVNGFKLSPSVHLLGLRKTLLWRHSLIQLKLGNFPCTNWGSQPNYMLLYHHHIGLNFLVKCC